MVKKILLEETNIISLRVAYIQVCGCLVEARLMPGWWDSSVPSGRRRGDHFNRPVSGESSAFAAASHCSVIENACVAPPAGNGKLNTISSPAVTFVVSSVPEPLLRLYVPPTLVVKCNGVE